MPDTPTDYATIRREMETRRAEAITRAERYGRRMTAAVWGVALVWYALGIGLILGSYHVALPSRANMAFWAGVTLCFAGPFFTWMIAFTLGRDRGLWS